MGRRLLHLLCHALGFAEMNLVRDSGAARRGVPPTNAERRYCDAELRRPARSARVAHEIHLGETQRRRIDMTNNDREILLDDDGNPLETFVIGTDDGEDTPAITEIEYSYEVDDPSAMKGLDAVRVRPGMYIGDNGGVRGLHHLFREILDNAVDEISAGRCDAVTVTLGDDDSLSVADNGRGIPVELFDDGKSRVEVVFTEIGGAQRHRSGVAKVGLHGVGAACVNALSEWVEVTVRQNGRVH